ncbi:cytochrome P450 [Brachybacterium paraconglomeratum]|uniref:cytochrome P450 n=1 Tax=Brachybacterium TaxID=43668 RepID=UPI003242FC63
MTARPFDSTLPFLREGYPFISSRCAALGTDVFRSRLALRPVTFVRGAEAAAMFYDGEHFTRTAAMPPSVQHLLQDAGSVQALDGAAHRHRKRAFLSLMTPAAMGRLGDLFEAEWRAAEAGWAGSRIVLHEAVREVLTRTACRWAGVPLRESEVRARTRELGLMIDGAGRFGPSNWYARARRRRTERWAAGLIERIRAGQLLAVPGTAAQLFAHHVDEQGHRLPPEIAAVELLNVLRPTVAVARFVVFAAVALHQHPRWRTAFAAGDEEDLEPFVQEVRRFYPFFPAVPGRTTRAFAWGGHRFRKGEWVILDLYGTCHDPRLWTDPDSFQPERFRGWSWQEHPNTLIAQGAGDQDRDHRCPGEGSTVELLKRAVVLLATSKHEVPPQDLSIALNRFPALPRSGFVLARP